MLSEIHYFTGFHAPNELVLESGQRLGPITIAYETYGVLNHAADNTIVICHPLSGDSHAACKQKDNPDYIGWWDLFVGPGKTIDTTKYFVVCSNVIGGCKGSTGPASINPATEAPYGTAFPVITIGDMVHAQKALIDHLGVKKIKMVIGGSMGGMQALEWAIQYPDLVQSCVPIAATAKLSPQALAFDAVGRHAIISDPKWNNGNYYGQGQPEHGLSVARMIGHITYLSGDSMNEKFGRRLQEKENFGYDLSTDFQIESYLTYQGMKFINRFDPNSYIYLTKAISYFDLDKKYGSLEAAMEKTRCDFLVISIASDWLYTPEQSKDIVKALINLDKRVTYSELQSLYGHDAFLIDNPKLFRLVQHFLEQSR